MAMIIPCNRLLASLAPADLSLLEPHLEPVELKAGEVLSEPHTPALYAYFLESGLAATVLGHKDDQTVEIGMIGNEGLVGLSIAVGVRQCPRKTVMLVPGHAQRIRAMSLVHLMEASSGLRAKVLAYSHTLNIQTSSTAMAHAALKIEQKLARWLLMAQDRLGDNLIMVHDFLAMVLGVRRPGVTVSLHILEGEHCLRSERGRITIRDREKLKSIVGPSYGIAEAEYERVMAPIDPATDQPAELPKVA